VVVCLEVSPEGGWRLVSSWSMMAARAPVGRLGTVGYVGSRM